MASFFTQAFQPDAFQTTAFQTTADLNVTVLTNKPSGPPFTRRKFQELMDEMEREIIPPAAIKALAGNTALSGQFDKKYGPGASTRMTIPRAAVSALKRDENLAEQFDAKYGKGASAKVLWE